MDCGETIHLKFLIHIVLFIAFYIAGGTAFAGQRPVPPTDLLEQLPRSADSLKTNTTESTGLEGPVKYRAERISFSVKERKTLLEKNVRIEYQNMTLQAGRVVIDWDRNYMVATGIADSTDSLGNSVYSGLPIFTEKGNEPISGIQLEYDFKHQRGKVLEGRTEMEPGYYKGKQIKKIGKKTLLVRDGYFTSCDSIEHPHYYFKANKMRIIVKKRAVAKPIYMYIADIPVFALPFGVFPMERGRRSGIIIPKFGTSSYGGNYLKRFGYYFAASQYWDATLLGHFYERTGTAYEGELRYKKRYSFSGNVNGKYAPKDVTTGKKISRWSLNFSHNQTLGSTASLNARGNFVSDRTFLQNFSDNLRDRLNQVLSTNVTFSKRWPASKNSLTMNIRRTENLQNGNLDYTLPRISFNHTSSALFPDGGKSGEKHWYNNIYYGYGSNFLYQGSKTFQEADSSFLRTTQSAWQHTANLSLNQKLFKYFKYSLGTRLEELWVPEYYNYTWVDSLNSATKEKVKAFKPRHVIGSTSLNVSTTIYGLFEIPFIPLKVIRHKMDPRIGVNFTPDLSRPEYGYVQTFRDSSGRTVRYDRFAGNAFNSPTPTRESRNISISVNNLFQGKIIKDGEERKIDLFSWNVGTNYNFLKDSLRWNDLSSSVQAKASKNIDFTLGATHSLYKRTRRGSGRRDEFVWSEGFALPRLVRIHMNASIHLAPQGKKEKEETAEEKETPAEEDITRDPMMEGLKNLEIPWDLNFRINYTMARSNIQNIQKRLTADLNGRIQLTRNWRVDYTANFDLIKKEIDHQNFRVYRDLHCWEMSFTWAPNPAYSVFSFEIRIKEPVLKDIKLTKSSGGQRPF